MTAAAHNPKHGTTLAPSDLLPGDVLDGKYRLDAIVGAGAMGQVWRAHNIMLDLAVAIKVVQPEAHGREAMDRLLTEARFEAQLRHPNIVKVIDVGRNQELAYVVMELLEGCTLADLMDEGPLPPTLAVRLIGPLLDGLGAAHKLGIVHRDIKPENIFIARTAGGRVCPKLLDFGIARSDTGTTRGPKKARVVMGTPGYMSPEQAWGEENVDQRSDLWALGVVLYEAVCGESAFACTDYPGFLRALEERELTPLSGEGSAELWKIIRHATTKACAERVPSSQELAQALAGFLRDRGVFEDLTGDSLPDHWATPGSLIYRAWRRQNPRMSMVPPPPASPRAQSRIVAQARPRNSATPMVQSVRSGAAQLSESSVRRLPRKPRSNRTWQALSLVLGGIFGVTISLARTTPSHKAHLESHPAIAHAMAAASSEPSAHIVPPSAADVAATSAWHEVGAQRPLAKKLSKKSAHKRQGANQPNQAPKNETRDGSQPRGKSRRAFAANVNTPSWPNAAQRVAVKREAAELGLKSPW
jgi:serine/threonine protein kinase